MSGNDRPESLETEPEPEPTIESIVSFMNACTGHFLGVERATVASVTGMISACGISFRNGVRAVRTSDGSLAGLAMLWQPDVREVKMWCRTHPRWRGRGAGSDLLRWARTDARRRGADRLTTTSWPDDDDAVTLLGSHGFGIDRHFLKMSLDRADRCPSVPVPAIVSSLDPAGRDDSELFEAWDRSFEGAYGPRSPDAGEFWAERRDNRLDARFAFDPQLWFIARRDTRVIGFVLCEFDHAKRLGRVAEFGVVPEHRGHGLGEALLRHGVARLFDLGADRVELDVDADNVTNALALYRRIGMRAEPAFTIWSTHLDPAVRAAL